MKNIIEYLTMPVASGETTSPCWFIYAGVLLAVGIVITVLHIHHKESAL